ncbi:unnamed protein product [Auanema sp. JU1783]|nr:unnamed protein product [Auanema sp. JU1783]
MSRFILLLLAVFLHSSNSKAILEVLMDPEGCTYLKCEFRGTGEHCNPASSLKEALKTGNGTSFKLLKGETDYKLLARLERRYDSNTFTIVRDINLGEKCEKKALWCNAVFSIVAGSLSEYLELVVNMRLKDC